METNLRNLKTRTCCGQTLVLICSIAAVIGFVGQDCVYHGTAERDHTGRTTPFPSLFLPV